MSFHKEELFNWNRLEFHFLYNLLKLIHEVIKSISTSVFNNKKLGFLSDKGKIDELGSSKT